MRGTQGTLRSGELSVKPAAAVVRQFAELWRQLLQNSDFGAGCAVLAVTVAGGDADVLEPAGRVFPPLKRTTGITAAVRWCALMLASNE